MRKQRSSVIEGLIAVGGTLLYVGAVVVLLVIVARSLEPPVRETKIDLTKVANADRAATPIVGTIADSSDFLLPAARVSLATYNASGQELARVFTSVDKDGVFRFSPAEFPSSTQLQSALIAAEAESHLASKVNVSIRVTDTVVQGSTTPVRVIEVTPSQVHLRLRPYTPWLTLIVLLPAVFGILLAIAHLTGYSRGLRVSQLYAFGAAGLWGFIVLWLLAFYVLRASTLIRFIWEDFFVSSGVIIFAFVGTMVYVVYSMHEKDPGFFVDASDDEKRRLLLALGGRILAAPYVALITFGLLTATFENLQTGAFAAFVGFFIGVWIKPALDFLNAIGLRLLSEDSRQKVLQKMLATEQREQATSDASLLRPNTAFFEAVEQARVELLTLKNVVGVDPGLRPTGEPAITVYVYEKDATIISGNPDFIPEVLHGVPTDVVPLPPAKRDLCRGTVFNLAWDKIKRDHAATSGGAAHASAASVVDDMVVVAGPGVFFRINAAGQNEFDIQAAYAEARPLFRSTYDFVAFVIDWASFGGFGHYVGHYYVPVFNDTSGINHYKGSNFNERTLWQSDPLIGCQVHSLDLNNYFLMHELAHAWCSYVTFRDRDSTGVVSTDLLMVADRPPADEQGRYHWGTVFDDGFSPMDYDLQRWVESPAGFAKLPVTDAEFMYCPLDLYLMGLLPGAEVGALTVLRSLSPKPGPPAGLFSAHKQIVTVADIVTACGARPPENVGRTFRQAFVIVAATPAAGQATAAKVRTALTAYEIQFARATRSHARVVTRL